MSELDELRAIGERLLMLAEGGTLGGEPGDYLGLADSSIDDRYLASMAQAIYASRRLRDQVLPGDLFGEPAWDMLLDLFIRAAEGKRTSVTSLCVASGVPVTTALRWVGTLQDAGLVVREESAQDRRVAYLKLSSDGFTAVRRCLLGGTRYVRPTQNFFLLHDEGGR